MGGYTDIYGFANIDYPQNLKVGAISGTFTYNNKTVTVVAFGVNSRYADFLMQVDGETDGNYNANVTLVDPDTNEKRSVYFSDMIYDDGFKGFIASKELKPGADLYDFFAASNVGKKYIIKVDIAKQ